MPPADACCPRDRNELDLHRGAVADARRAEQPRQGTYPHRRPRGSASAPRAPYPVRSRGDEPRRVWAREDSNLRATDYESAALTAELLARCCPGESLFAFLRFSDAAAVHWL